MISCVTYSRELALAEMLDEVISRDHFQPHDSMILCEIEIFKRNIGGKNRNYYIK